MKKLIYTFALFVGSLHVLAQTNLSSNEAEALIFAQSHQLISFTSSVQNNVVQLDWSTAWEKDFDGFTLERAASNLEFKVIGKVKAKGDSDKKMSYNLVDENPLQGQAYYRLKTTGLDGNVEYHNIISAFSEGLAKSSTESYPKVVTKHYLKLEISKALPNEIRLLDFCGEVVYSCLPKADTNYLRLPEQVKPGAYLLVLLRPQGIQHQQKIMIP